jgi:aryl-alcohol dehydrogenase-like predicted oxidoreductase
MSKFAFGTYRISDYNLQHIQALKEALHSGITMIDTSSNYMDGGAERAIALALKEFDASKRESIEIVSKVGYIQGQNMQTHQENPFDEVVLYDPNCFHSIAPSFIEQQLSASLERLQTHYLDCYLLHNPEYFLLDAINRGIAKDERLDGMYERIYRAFVALEKEVANKRILSYGISSNSFAKESSDEEFLPYEDLVILATNAAESLGHKEHSFTTIQLPINLLEQEGLKCASWAKANGLRVLANRPLNAIKDNQMYRLAEYEESREYYHHLNELLEVSDNELLQPLYNLLEELDDSKHKFGWVGDYEAFLYAQILPHIKNVLIKITNEESRDVLLNFIEMFLNEYKNMVAYECGIKTRGALQAKVCDIGETLQECALKFLMQRAEIDRILVGMRKPSYVNEVLALEC